MNDMTNIALIEIFKNCKTSRFDKEPDFDEVVKQVSSKLEVPPSDKLLSDIKVVFIDFQQQQNKNRSAVSSSRSVDEKVVLQRHTYVPKAKRPLEEVSDRQQRRRLSDYMDSTKAAAQAENTSPTKMFAFGLKNKYLQNKEVAKVGHSILRNESIPDRHVSLEVASAIYESGKMTKRIYTDIRLLLKDAGADVLPSYNKLLKFKKERRPTVQKLATPYSGVKYDYLQCLQLTSAQLFASLQLPAFHNLNEIQMTLHDGLDGSGGHSIFNQKGSIETNNIIMFMFRIENLKTVYGEVLWENPSHASSSSCRPVMLLMGKETRENCEVVADLQKERQGVKFSVDHLNKSINVEVHAKMSMIDGKMHTTISGLGGAFCCLCTKSKEQCHDVDFISSGFKVDRSLEDTLEICEKDMHLEENRKKEDYDVRKGVTQLPITTEDINNMHPLHNLLRCFGWIFKICYHAIAGHLSWSEAKLNVSNRVARALEFLKQAKEEIQARVKEETSITLEKADPTGHGGSSTTGNIAKVMLNTNNRKLLTQGIESSELRAKIDQLVLNMAVILTIINSDRKVKIDEFREFCRTTYLYVASIPWIHITPSAHAVLGHSAELIGENGCIGLLNFTESGLEANNKFLRQYRINKSRKTNQFDNLSDCINRLWDKSDPSVMKARERLNCRHCKGTGHSIRSCEQLKAAIIGCNTEYESLLCFLTDDA